MPMEARKRKFQPNIPTGQNSIDFLFEKNQVATAGVVLRPDAAGGIGRRTEAKGGVGVEATGTGIG
jgi:hypothetical protein